VIDQDARQVFSKLFSSPHVLSALKDVWSVVTIRISVKNVVITISSILQPRNVLYAPQTVSFAVAPQFALFARVVIWSHLMELASFLQ